jgi:hypothetical protein
MNIFDKILYLNKFNKIPFLGAFLLMFLFLNCCVKPKNNSSLPTKFLKNAELKPYFNFLEAKDYLEQKNYEQAKNLALSLINTSNSLALSLRSKYLLADIALAEQDYWRAITLQEELLKKGYGDKEILLINMALSLEKVGQISKSNDVYKTLFIEFPNNKQNKIKDIAQINLSIKEQEKRFNNLIAKLKFEQAINDINLSLNKNIYNQEEKSILNSFKNKALIIDNKLLTAFNLAKKRALRIKALPKDLETYAFTLGKLGRSIEASDYYLQFAKASNNKKDQAKGCFFSGFLLYEASLYSLSQLRFAHCSELLSNSEYEEDSLWYQGLSAIISEDFLLANEYLDMLNKKYLKSSEKEKYLYFKAFVLVKLHKQDEAKIIFSKLVKQTNLSYYALLARKYLKINSNMDKLASSRLTLSSNNQQSIKNNVELLYNLGFKEEAKELINKSSLTTNDKMALLQEIGEMNYVWQRSNLLNTKIILDDKKVIADNSIRAQYPLPHEKIVNKVSKKYAINKSLIYAIMQTESGFLSSATSYRGAMGLMQMMPHVAKDLAHKLNIKEFTTELLHQPKINIKLGGMMIANLKKEFAKTHLFIAAYNAGPHQVRKWLNNFGNLPEELFVERIPFKQTREYVKKVLPSESLYYALQGNNLRLAL